MDFANTFLTLFIQRTSKFLRIKTNKQTNIYHISLSTICQDNAGNSFRENTKNKESCNDYFQVLPDALVWRAVR